MLRADRVNGEEITGYEMLDAREDRAARQSEWLTGQEGCCLVSVTMNIAGAVKSTPLIREGFAAGMELVDDTLKNLGVSVLHGEEWLKKTGCEGFRLVRGSASEVKRAMIGIEEACAFGRLMDIDVLGTEQKPLTRDEMGLPERRCLVCGAPARNCGRTQKHPYEELQAVTNEIIHSFLVERRADRVAAMACRSMLYEVLVTPKPGLVDRANSGSHTDMDVFTFAASASALTPYLRSAYLLGSRGTDRLQLLTGLRAAGRLAEEEMNRATDGVNTHKGMIYSMGLLCGALGFCEANAKHTLEDLLSECGALAGETVTADFGDRAPSRQTNGYTLYKTKGVGGIRAEAAAGFPAVRQTALPILTELMRRGYTPNDAGAYTLLALLGRVTDTNMIARGGMEKAAAAKAAAHDLWLAAPVPEALPDLAAIGELDAAFIAEHLSPGGCADLLAISFFLYYLNEETTKWQT